MGLFSRKKDEAPKPRRKQKKFARRSYAASIIDRLSGDFRGSNKSAASELVGSLYTMRARSRQLCMDNDYAKKFLAMVAANVVGNKGISLQARARRDDGSLDTLDNSTIEAAWAEWGNIEHCTVTGRQSWVDVQKLVIKSIARDGECLVVMVRGFDNEFGFALQVLESDHLDENYNTVLSNGNRIVMGVELNRWGAPVAYHLNTSHPGDDTQMFQGKNYRRIPAADVLHLYIDDRAGQVRGVPWMHTAINRLNQVGAYEEAELIAARIASSKMGFYTSPDGDQYVGDEDDDGNLLMDMEPGVLEQLPAGVDFTAFDPQHPTSAYQAFIKTALRGAASGLNVAYNTLANDLEGVNFSSIRSGVLEEREQWRAIQSWLSQQLCRRVYRAWLVQALTTQALALPQRKFDKFTSVEWQPRGWAWVDPLKDQQANALAVELGVMSRTEIAATQGRDFEDTLRQLERENELLRQYGLTVEQEAQIYKYHIDSGVVTKNEVRDDLGLDPISGGDAPMPVNQSASGGE